MQEILDSGKRLGVPKCTGKGIMDAYEIQNLEQLKIGSYGILEPGEECDIILDPTEIQFAIMRKCRKTVKKQFCAGKV